MDFIEPIFAFVIRDISRSEAMVKNYNKLLAEKGLPMLKIFLANEFHFAILQEYNFSKISNKKLINKAISNSRRIFFSDPPQLESLILNDCENIEIPTYIKKIKIVQGDWLETLFKKNKICSIFGSSEKNYPNLREIEIETGDELHNSYEISTRCPMLERLTCSYMDTFEGPFKNLTYLEIGEAPYLVSFSPDVIFINAPNIRHLKMRHMLFGDPEDDKVFPSNILEILETEGIGYYQDLKESGKIIGSRSQLREIITRSKKLPIDLNEKFPYLRDVTTSDDDFVFELNHYSVSGLRNLRTNYYSHNNSCENLIYTKKGYNDETVIFSDLCGSKSVTFEKCKGENYIFEKKNLDKKIEIISCRDCTFDLSNVNPSLVTVKNTPGSFPVECNMINTGNFYVFRYEDEVLCFDDRQATIYKEKTFEDFTFDENIEYKIFFRSCEIYKINAGGNFFDVIIFEDCTFHSVDFLEDIKEYSDNIGFKNCKFISCEKKFLEIEDLYVLA